MVYKDAALPSNTGFQGINIKKRFGFSLGG